MKEDICLFPKTDTESWNTLQLFCKKYSVKGNNVREKKNNEGKHRCPAVQTGTMRLKLEGLKEVFFVAIIGFACLFCFGAGSHAAQEHFKPTV